ncbi:hypothetical protein M9978_12415 [Sphingomonas sp. MG17]|uniref:Uncharacterized protein n=1 Tax=Sphingomonas tagetis TaxID=2949092 RepID=A0A9X2KLV8_9SPHN|nr:hypothetical protein [Sphingomonas tagetis]MCP3731230.1 hypothetical protein [Sphingomonas tagetis]
MRPVPDSILPLGGAASELLTVRLPAEQQDIVAARESFARYKSQFAAAEMENIDKTMRDIWNGVAYLRPWNGPAKGAAALFRR